MNEDDLNELTANIETTAVEEAALPEIDIRAEEGEREENLVKQQNRKKKKRNRRIRTIILLVLALVCVCMGIYFIFFYNYEAYQRQSTEEEIADIFIQELIEMGLEEETEDETEDNYSYTPDYSVRESTATTPTETASIDDDGTIRMGTYNFTDDVYLEKNGITYTPDYAQGDLLFVLEFPSCEIRRGVYGGTWDDIYYDLNIWMVTIAHPSMELGETHISIYGHNHTSQNLSFNNLKAAQIGDVFYLYAYSGVYTYEVTNIFSEWRSSTTNKYVNDFSISSDVCYIITCGRDNFLINGESTRYKDYIVEGHLVEHKSLTEYALEVISGETY